MSEEHTCGCGTGNGGAVDDVPMCRYSNPIPTCEHSGGCGRGLRGEQLEQIAAALNCQNQLLVDLLGAINCLTAALLVEHT